jgi:hypothetical protein
MPDYMSKKSLVSHQRRNWSGNVFGAKLRQVLGGGKLMTNRRLSSPFHRWWMGHY